MQNLNKPNMSSRPISRSLAGRFGPVVFIASAYLIITFLTRCLLLAYSSAGFEWKVATILGTFGVGLLYDLTICSFVVIPLVLHTWLTTERMYHGARKWILPAVLGIVFLVLKLSQIVPADFNEDLRKVVLAYVLCRMGIFIVLAIAGPAFRIKWRKAVLFFDLSLVTFLLLFNAVSEFFFWEEFSGRYNFIAVDYLVYTTEVIGNIRESYPVGWLIAGTLVCAVALVWMFRKSVIRSVEVPVSFFRRTLIALCILSAPAIAFFTIKPDWKKFSSNTYANELAGNGIYDFTQAFFENELDFYRYYKVLPDVEAFQLVRRQLESPYSQFLTNDSLDIERQIAYPEKERKLNVVLISVESLSASFLGVFGNEQHLTPFMDSLANHSIFFTNFYASGTRTVRGLEALTLSLPPTPGQSVVKRKDNKNLFSIGSVFNSKGYQSQYIYGGYSYFDNMHDFFHGNNYQVIDRKKILPSDVHFSNIWGVADEDLFTLALKEIDRNDSAKKPFFTHIMTVSNHRPFTYPEGRIDISPQTQTREGAIKYTDYAIGRFIAEASQKPWFKNTVFVIVADHCAGSAGSVELPVTGYHIPLFIYSPGNIQPRKFDRLTSQIDLAPTLFGLLHFSYRSKFMGRDILNTPPDKERAFISTYQGLGFISEGRLIIQWPKQKIEQFKPDFTTGKSESMTPNDSLSREAISFYQVASYMLRNGKFRN